MREKIAASVLTGHIQILNQIRRMTIHITLLMSCKLPIQYSAFLAQPPMLTPKMPILC